MKTAFYSGISAGALSLALAVPAYADISAQEVRDGLIGYYESFGYTVEIGSEEVSGGAIAISDLSLTMDLPDDGGQITIILGEMTFLDSGDGGAEIQLPDITSYTIQFSEGGEVEAVAVLDVEMPDFQALVSGSLDNMRIESSGSSMNVSLESLTVEGESIPVSGSISSGEFASDYSIEKLEEDRHRIGGDYSIQSLGMLVNAQDPDGDGTFSLKASFADLVASGSGELKATDDPFELLAAGFAFDAELEGGPASVDVNFQDGSDRFAMIATADGGRFAAEISPEVIAYEIIEKGVDLNLTSSEIPFPAITLDYDEAEISFSIPLAQSAEPADYHARVALRGFSISEAIWGMFDPGQTLSRDPATIAMDVSGKMMVLVNLMDMETLAKIDNMDGPPMLPLSLDINELTASIAGALLEGAGAFTLNMDNPVVIDGIPLPNGELNLSLKGGFGLLDSLVAIGLVPEDASMGLRAMLGAFAKPVGEDHFESKIEVTPEGAIMANGQRIQ